MYDVGRWRQAPGPEVGRSRRRCLGDEVVATGTGGRRQGRPELGRASCWRGAAGGRRGSSSTGGEQQERSGTGKKAAGSSGARSASAADGAAAPRGSRTWSGSRRGGRHEFFPAQALPCRQREVPVAELLGGRRPWRGSGPAPVSRPSTVRYASSFSWRAAAAASGGDLDRGCTETGAARMFRRFFLEPTQWTSATRSAYSSTTSPSTSPPKAAEDGDHGRAVESRLRWTATTTTGVQWRRCDRLRPRPKVVARVSINTCTQPAACLEEKLGSWASTTATHHAPAGRPSSSCRPCEPLQGKMPKENGFCCTSTAAWASARRPAVQAELRKAVIRGVLYLQVMGELELQQGRAQWENQDDEELERHRAADNLRRKGPGQISAWAATNRRWGCHVAEELGRETTQITSANSASQLR